MHTDSLSISVLCFLIFVLPIFHGLYAQEPQGLGRNDGPYFFYQDGQTTCIRVVDGKIEQTQKPMEVFPVSTEDGRHRFDVSRQPLQPVSWSYAHHDKILVLSDPHGDFESFYAILKSQGVIGSQYEWTFGRNHLVIIGDVFDRGKDVLPIFWLIYKLEHEAAQHGGKVHFLLGNHEEMLMRENYKYSQAKYLAIAEATGKNYRDFWALDTELGKWLLQRNTMEKIGDYLFVHAGISVAMLDSKWSISVVNDTVRHYLFHAKEERQQSEDAVFLFGSDGPLWYRGMVRHEEKYHPLKKADLKKIMKFYGSKKIFVGHTIFPEVSSFFGGQVVAVNVNNDANRKKGRSRGVLIDGGNLLFIYDDITKNSQQLN